VRKSFGIRTYLSISHALLLVLSLGTIGLIWSRNEYQVITRELQGLMQDRVVLLANIISHEIAEHDEVKLESNELSAINQDKNLFAVYIDNSGAFYELAPGTVSSVQQDLIQQLNSERPIYHDVYTSLIHSEVESTSIYAAAPVFDAQNRPIGTACLLMPIGYLDAYITRLRWMLLGAIFVVALLGIGGAFIVAHYFSRQFAQAQELAATVANGSYQLRIPEKGPTELRDLSHYLNLMAEKLQEQLITRQRLLANVAHELARPLAGLQLGIESLRKGAIQDADLADDLLVNMAHTTRRLEDLIDDISLAARPESHQIELHRTDLAVEPFLRGVATRFWSMAQSRGINLEVQVEPGLPPVFADEKRLNQIIGNLMDNAIKFTPPGKTVSLSAELVYENSVRFLVHDGGQGISSEEINNLYKPFYQGDIGRRIKQGMGLGLSIAQQLAVAHGGDLTLENHPQGGALAVLTLPIASDPSPGT
jgi:signal transduction histidine kinase